MCGETGVKATSLQSPTSVGGVKTRTAPASRFAAVNVAVVQRPLKPVLHQRMVMCPPARHSRSRSGEKPRRRLHRVQQLQMHLRYLVRRRLASKNDPYIDLRWSSPLRTHLKPEPRYPPASPIDPSDATGESATLDCLDKGEMFIPISQPPHHRYSIDAARSAPYRKLRAAARSPLSAAASEASLRRNTREGKKEKSMESSQMLGKLSPTFALGTVTVV